VYAFEILVATGVVATHESSVKAPTPALVKLAALMAPEYVLDAACVNVTLAFLSVVSPTAPAPVIVPLVEVRLMLAPVPVEPEFLIAAALAMLPLALMLTVAAVPELVIEPALVKLTPVFVVVAT